MDVLRGWEVPGAALVGFVLSQGVLLAQAAVPEIPTPGSIGAGILISLITAAITAIGTTFFQPWLRTKDLAAKNVELMSRLSTQEDRYVSLLARVETQDRVEREMGVLLAQLTERAMHLNARCLRLASAMLVSNEFIERGSASEKPVTLDDLMVVQSGKPVLLVDANSKAREAMAVLLEARGYQVSHAASAAEALITLETLHFDSVLMDLDIEGCVIVVRHLTHNNGVTRLIATGVDDHPVLVEARKAGQFTMLRRPIRFDECLLPALKGEPKSAKC